MKGLNHLQPHHIQHAVETELTKMAKQSTDNANQITTGVATSAGDFEGTVVKRVKVPSKSKNTQRKKKKQERQRRKPKR